MARVGRLSNWQVSSAHTSQDFFILEPLDTLAAFAGCLAFSMENQTDRCVESDQESLPGNLTPTSNNESPKQSHIIYDLASK